jgi:hypothetical protein
MKKMFVAALMTALAFALPAVVRAQAEQTAEKKPPIAQPLVREGDLAVKLVDAFKLGPAADEIEAESRLGDAGIAPRNGWIADYPATPDVIGELKRSISEAARNKRLHMGKTQALRALEDVLAGLKLEIGGEVKGQTSESSGYDQTVINNYYYEEGPPIVTYYPPPPEYVYLYTWVPYPFRWWNFPFPGYYILFDFHRIILVHNRVEVISNHFVNHRTDRIFRIDPVRRYRGRTFAGVGVPYDAKRFIYPRGAGGAVNIFRGERERGMAGRRKPR